MSSEVSQSALSSNAGISGAAATGAIVLMIRAVALVVFILMSLAEPFVAAITGCMALGCFCVSVFFGFILRAPFQHRWFVLAASVVFMLIYFAFRFAMMGVQRLLR